MNTLTLLLHLLLHTFLLLTSALPTPNPQSQSQSAEPKTLCTTTAQSPPTSLITEAITAYTNSCSTPASVPTSKACINLAESADSGYYISLCGWHAAFTDCADAGALVGALVEACAEEGRAEGQISGEWGTVVVGRVVGKTGST
ncbi:uncharacterized protein LAJ45_07789 [Morchella importuna]|uniref:Extracellular membrane protein CFEM domain-containing protein n=1 Tax=Morchella conica CCBAS932 TaxID=1392247 RepID=A0A3N4KLU4_9PEZI|nr:uncharacterized protein LAJ45_07789 [Morchella importuna]KAH8148025.1 hypothetical protein LAJ45_07789 [Morchella importuna]RPB11533.1 hypothetical protein P167DRAFT_546341 [Morchella conica CCBAS932]